MARPEHKQKSPDVIELQLQFPVKISVLTGILTIVLDVLYYAYSGKPTDTLVFMAGTAAAAGAILAAFYTGKALSLQINAAHLLAISTAQCTELEKKKLSLQLAARWNEPSMHPARKICREIVNMKSKGLAEILPIRLVAKWGIRC